MLCKFQRPYNIQLLVWLPDQILHHHVQFRERCGSTAVGSINQTHLHFLEINILYQLLVIIWLAEYVWPR